MFIVPWAFIDWCFLAASLWDSISDRPVIGEIVVSEHYVSGNTDFQGYMWQWNTIVLPEPLGYLSFRGTFTWNTTTFGNNASIATGRECIDTFSSLVCKMPTMPTSINEVLKNKSTTKLSAIPNHGTREGLLRRCVGIWDLVLFKDCFSGCSS